MSEYALLDTLFEAAAVLDAKGKIIYFNHHFSTVFKASPRIIKKLNSIYDLFDASLPFPKDLLPQAINGSGSYLSEELDLLSKDQDGPVHVVIKLTSLTKENISGQFLMT